MGLVIKTARGKNDLKSYSFARKYNNDGLEEDQIMMISSGSLSMLRHIRRIKKSYIDL